MGVNAYFGPRITNIPYLTPAPVEVINVNYTKREITILIVQTTYSVYNTIRKLTLIMS